MAISSSGPNRAAELVRYQPPYADQHDYHGPPFGQSAHIGYPRAVQKEQRPDGDDYDAGDGTIGTHHNPSIFLTLRDGFAYSAYKLTDELECWLTHRL